MGRDIVQIPVANRETLVRARFWSRVLFDNTAKFQDNFMKSKMISIFHMSVYYIHIVYSILIYKIRLNYV